MAVAIKVHVDGDTWFHHTEGGRYGNIGSACHYDQDVIAEFVAEELRKLYRHCRCVCITVVPVEAE